MPLNLQTVLLSTVSSLCLCVVADGADIPGGQVFYGDTTIGPEDTVKGSITVVDGTLTVYGTVEKNITQIGPGDVCIDGFNFGGVGRVDGNIREDGEGIVGIFRADVGGNIDELDEGYVGIESSIVAGNISEQVGGDGVGVLHSLILGNIFETGSGSIVVQLDSVVDGNLREEGAGNVVIGFSFVEGLDLVTGNIFESGPGEVLIDSGAVVEGNIESE